MEGTNAGIVHADKAGCDEKILKTKKQKQKQIGVEKEIKKMKEVFQVEHKHVS